MKILIAADMEGVTGVVNWHQTEPAHADYPRFRKQMTADVNAAIEGVTEALTRADIEGVAESDGIQIVVADGHNDGTNILLEELDPRAQLNSGNDAPLCMVQGIDGTFDGVFFIGYHARAGSYMAVLDHTWTGQVMNVWLNGELVGETGLNAAVCGHFGVPVIMISGDQTACDQAMELLGPVEVAVVKQASGRMSAQCLTPLAAQKKICEAAVRAVNRLKSGEAPAPYQPAQPVHIRFELANSLLADNAALLPGAHRVDGRTVELEAPDMVVAYKAFRAAVQIAT